MSFPNKNFTTASEMMKNLKHKDENESTLEPFTQNRHSFQYNLDKPIQNSNEKKFVNPEKESYAHSLFHKTLHGSPLRKSEDVSEKNPNPPQVDQKIPVNEKIAYTKTSFDYHNQEQKTKITNPYLKTNKKPIPCFNPIQHLEKDLLITQLKTPLVSPKFPSNINRNTSKQGNNPLLSITHENKKTSAITPTTNNTKDIKKQDSTSFVSHLIKNHLSKTHPTKQDQIHTYIGMIQKPP